jgi:hypothetical protein
MPQPRRYKDNAARQAAYRARKRQAEGVRAAALQADSADTPGTRALVRRVMAESRRGD